MPPPATLIRLGPDNLDAAHALSRGEGWPHRREEWQFLLALGTGFGLRAHGRLLGTAILIPYGDNAATASMIIVAPEARGIGLGRQLMAQLLTEAGTRECRLVATEAGRPLYERLGFAAVAPIRQYQGHVDAAAPPPSGIANASLTDLPLIAALDRKASGMDRSAMLRQQAAAGAVFLLDREGSGLRGYASCRDFGRGQVLGPLVACDDISAARLLRAALARHHGRFLRVDLTVAGMRHLPLLAAGGLSLAGDGLAMLRPGDTPAAAPDGAAIFTLASQALG